MNNIPITQNAPRQLVRLAAQRQLYATAKILLGWQMILSGPVAVILALSVNAMSELKAYVSLWGILVGLSDVLWLNPWQERLRKKAAGVQELFDCDILEIPWDDLKVGERPDPELVKEQSDKYNRWAKIMPPLTNWYGSEVGSLPLHIARLACQRSNCWWDATQRRRYAVWVLSGVLVVFFILLFIAMGYGLTLEDFVLKVATPCFPAFILGTRQYMEQMKAASRLDKLKFFVERLWEKALAGQLVGEIEIMSRALQTEIFDNRKQSPLIFDGIFRQLRREYEDQMTHGIAEYATQAKKALGLM